MSGPVKALLYAAVLGLVMLAAIVLTGHTDLLPAQLTAFLARSPGFGQRFEKPDLPRMRAYVVSRLSDARLIEMRAKAQADFDRHVAQEKESGKQFYAERERRLRACEANPAEKLRRPNGCWEPLPIGFEDIGKPSYGWEAPEKFFEDLLMGACRYADTVADAKQTGCLPP